MDEDKTVQKAAGRKNRLAEERSPYLRQHSDNPVDWYPWGEEAFQKAEREDKPIFLSIGYSSCHWCHVMAEESFQDEDVAKAINASFVPVKVDREERPDIDNTYMMTAQLLTGRGGWPLTIIMTPDKKPFFAGTYLPKNAGHGIPGLMDVLGTVSDFWKTRRSEIDKASRDVMNIMQQDLGGPAEGGVIDAEVQANAAARLGAGFDPAFGGFGPPPKFPTPHAMTLLLRHWRRTGDKKSLSMADKTLEMMRAGGIFDQLGGGFHRYSTDREWLVPHFEKMLYDQALLAVAYVEAWQATGKEAHARTAREVLDYVLRDMTSPGGAFYSAEDADSEGEEGKFYVWREDEAARVLSPGELDLARKLFGISEQGNMAEGEKRLKQGKNVLRLSAGASPGDQRLEGVRSKLLAARGERARPFKDDKVMTDWNGLMIGAFARAGAALGERGYVDAAAKAADDILSTMRRPDGSLLHVQRGNGGVGGFLEDHAFLAWGLLELYQADLDQGWLEAALDISKSMIDRFWDPAKGGFFMTADGAPDVVHRRKDFYDGATPSGNSMALMDLLVLARITEAADLRDKAESTIRAFSAGVARAPEAHTAFLNAVDFRIGPSYSVVVSGKRGAEDTGRLLREVDSKFVPNKVVLLNEPRPGDGLVRKISPLVRGHEMKNGKAVVQVCTEKECLEETSDPQVLGKLFDGE